MQNKTKYQYELSDIQNISVDLLNQYKNKKVWCFEGEMGAGKTTLILDILKKIGIEHPEGSPTYSLVNEYVSPLLGKVYHYDLFRLNSEEEALDIGVEEVLYGNSGLVLVEWPKKIENLLPNETIWLYLSIQEDNSRRLSVEL